MTKPNILFIMLDQCRYDALSCTGNWVKTPNIDRIAAEGTLFTDCVTNAPLCIPARVSLATGLYCHNTGIWSNLKHDMSAEARTWMQVVRNAGYRTSLFGKTHLHRHEGDLRDREHLMHAYGLDDIDEIGGPRASHWVMSHMTELWEKEGHLDNYRADYDERFSNKKWIARSSALPLELYADVYVGQRAKEYLQSYDRSEPWCCWVSFGGPHEPYDAPEPYASMYDPADMPLPKKMLEDGQERPQGQFDDIRASHRKNVQFDEGEVAALRANYAGNMTLIDDQIGEILEAIEKRNELDNTVIVFTSDHGEMNGDYGLLAKSNFTDSAVHVPMIVRIPGQTNPGYRCNTPVEWMDAGVTMAELAGGEIDYPQFGCSLAGLREDNDVRPGDGVISELSNEIMFMDREWKAVLNRKGEVYLLFDRGRDPQESCNLAGRPESKSIEDQLRLRLLQRIMQTNLNHDPREQFTTGKSGDWY